MSDTPGTTRDAIDTPLSLEGTDYVLVDTAGLRRPSHVDPGLERLMVLKTIKALSRAEVAVLLLDAQEGLTGQDLRIAGLIEDQAKGCLILLNKWDLVPRELQEKTLVKVTDGLEFMAYVPLLPVSVKTGYNLRKVFPLVNEIYAQSGRRASTHELTEFIRELTSRMPPPRYRDRPVKFLYLTQAEVHPPTFVAFVNQPQGVPDSYRRFLVKQLRERLAIPHAPVRLFLKGRQRRKQTPLAPSQCRPSDLRATSPDRYQFLNPVVQKPRKKSIVRNLQHWARSAVKLKEGNYQQKLNKETIHREKGLLWRGKLNGRR